MTPDQIQKAIEAAISHNNPFPWWSYLLWFLLAFVGSYVAAYLREKGKNLATKEDIEDITARVEEVKSDYRKSTYRFQIVASGLLRKRAQVIEEIYHLIVDTEEIFGRFVSLAEWKNDPSKDDLRKEGGRLLYEFLRKYKRNRIYFKEEVCGKLQTFSDSIYKAILPYSFALTAQLAGQDSRDFTERWVHANEDFNEKIATARKTIEDEFRRLLGVAEIELHQDSGGNA